MTQEELKKEIDELLGDGDRAKYAVDWTESLIDLINQHVKEVIGEDDKWNPNRELINLTPVRNSLRAEQRKRAGL